MHIKNTVRYHYTPIGTTKIKNSDNTKYWWGCWSLIYCWWECKMVQLYSSIGPGTNLLRILRRTISNYVPRETKTYLQSHKNLYMNAYSSLIWKNWKHPKCPSMKWSQVAQSCPILCDPMDCSLPGSSHRIFQAKVLEWVAISFSRGSSPPRDRTQVSCTAGRWFTVWATMGEWLNQLCIHIKEYYLTIKKGTTDIQNNLNESPEIMLSEKTSLKILYTVWLHYITSWIDKIQLMENRKQTVRGPKEGWKWERSRCGHNRETWRILVVVTRYQCECPGCDTELCFARRYHWGKLYEICLCYFLQLHVNV